MNKYNLNINGKTVSVEAEPSTPFIYILRNDLKLKGTKYGCGLEQCGACLVISDGEAVYSCSTPISDFKDKNIITIEGIGGPDNLHPIQKAFIDERAAQCGYCIPGIIISSKILLDNNPKPNEEDVRQALANNLCRCGTHNSIIKAVLRTSKGMGE